MKKIFTLVAAVMAAFATNVQAQETLAFKMNPTLGTILLPLHLTLKSLIIHSGVSTELSEHQTLSIRLIIRVTELNIPHLHQQPQLTVTCKQVLVTQTQPRNMMISQPTATFWRKTLKKA